MPFHGYANISQPTEIGSAKFAIILTSKKGVHMKFYVLLYTCICWMTKIYNYIFVNFVYIINLRSTNKHVCILTPGMAHSLVSPLLMATNSSTGFPLCSFLAPSLSLFHLV